MKMMEAKKPHICKDCEKTIEVGEKYYSQSYRDLCVTCYGIRKQNFSQPFKQGMACIYCGKPAIGQLYGNLCCEDHIGDAVEAKWTEAGKMDPSAMRVVDVKKTKESEDNG